MELVLGALGAVVGIAVAVLLFALAWRFVGRARLGNARLRQARQDPHRGSFRNADDKADPYRDIPQ
jgi:hypothetical protein